MIKGELKIPSIEGIFSFNLPLAKQSFSSFKKRDFLISNDLRESSSLLKGDIDEQDAIDTLSMISLIHRKLDKAEEARKMYEGNF